MSGVVEYNHRKIVMSSGARGAVPTLARNAFEEAIRFESPVQTFFRTTTRAVDIGGLEVGEGEKVLMLLGAANRDPRRWAEPDSYDIARKTSGHVGFGVGIHMCVGQLVARLLARHSRDGVPRWSWRRTRGRRPGRRET